MMTKIMRPDHPKIDC